MRILRDEVVPDSGNARIRVINASPGIKDADVALQGQKDPILSDVDYAPRRDSKANTIVLTRWQSKAGRGHHL